MFEKSGVHWVFDEKEQEKVDLTEDHEGKHYAQKYRRGGTHTAIKLKRRHNMKPSMFRIKHHGSDIDQQSH